MKLTQKIPFPKIKQKKSLYSLLCVIVLATLLLSAKLLQDMHHEDGVYIEIEVIDAQGIIPGKTEIMYHGFPIGKVQALNLTKDMTHIALQVQIDDQYKKWLTNKTEFWVMRAQLSLFEISGLDTLFSGNYIAIKPSTEGDLTHHFIARRDPVVLENDKGSFYITLTRSVSHSISIGSPIYFKQIQVGKVVRYLLDPLSNEITMRIAIQKEYRQLIRKNTRFWEVSGINLEGDLSGFRLKSESLISLLKGGIAFETPDWEDRMPLADPAVDKFVLYDDKQDAQLGVVVEVDFPLTHSVIDKDTIVMFRGLKIGMVQSVSIAPDLSHFTAKIVIDPTARRLLVEGTQFWIVRSELNLHKIKNLSSLLDGPYIALDVDIKHLTEAKVKHEFKGQDNISYTPLNKSGLNLILTSDHLGDVIVNTVIEFKGQKIGVVNAIHLSKHTKQFNIYLNIAKEYAYLINASTQFINNTGVNISGSLTDFKVTLPSLTDIVSGVISIETFNINAKPLKSGDHKQLLDVLIHPSDLIVNIVTNNLKSFKKGLPILYRGIPVGKLINYKLSDFADHVILEGVIFDKYSNLVTANTKFWDVSGLEIEAGLLSGVQIKTHSLDTIISGGIAFATPNATDPAVQSNHVFTLEKKFKKSWRHWNPKRPLKVMQKTP